MGRNPSCSKEGLNKGAWTAVEDKLLIKYVNAHGEGKWTTVPHMAGLKRSGKSCRLRWLNYLRPNVKRGNFSEEEIDLIIRLHKLLGNSDKYASSSPTMESFFLRLIATNLTLLHWASPLAIQNKFVRHRLLIARSFLM